ncbi:hypothetical protein [Mesoflavibacter sp. SCSIO 43206]|uniref:hypothetical protein n=1 Tax=Mesoflavibacter sp. SCSIO 43206 TaxID=2779362 RepID=UPI001CA9BEE5|nr:hypothetical protein [Mesoflavibacter sp. SCSIO 43206]UAB74306.1 hypothetical protein INR78_07825 [Mesoflavibacter sp. SCSIO 43206]
MTYQEQLDRIEWKKKREEIIERDNFCCNKCGIERNKILGLSKDFGINSYNDLIEKGYSVSLSNTTPKLICILKNSFMNLCFYFGKIETVQSIKDLNYAIQWIENENVSSKKSKRFVCFDKTITIKDMYDLNVHHKYYVENKLAWEYNNDALITLCADCHYEEHQNNKIPYYSAKGEILGFAENCLRCDGSGYLSEFNYYKNGICFACMGTGSNLK